MTSSVRGLRIVLALTLATAFGAPLRAAQTSGDAAAMSRGWTFDEKGGAALFAHVCAACHQPDARGHFGNAFPDALSPTEVAAARALTKAQP